MSTSVRVQIDKTQKILLKRYLNKNGQAQVKFTKEVAKNCNNYVPFLTGRLKDMSVQLKTDKIIWSAPYAKKQYYLNKGGNRGALRGKYWDKRMWSDKGDRIVQTIADFAGGRKR
ncbi:MULTISPECIES: minor capsid protein [Clostridium]|nr:minor capsid protein [Clostridium sporogenes]AVP61695.1 capsid protein [Clostridium botulinum]MDU4599185.1 minor capsid protein [Clostridium sporogenes]NFQ34654.1 capsid protein [Clostridium sporogenes]NFQ60961.1 capsid protein [Clostridium sporogenes]NFQ85417.1 capsid protein [Clostridium sporogenes]